MKLLNSQFARAAATLFSVAAVAGCSFINADEQNGPSPEVGVPAKNVETWVLPMDGLLISDADDFRRVFAEALLVHDCLATQGLPSPTPALDVQLVMDSPTRAGDGMRNLSEANASTFGYLGGADKSFLDELNTFLEWESSQTGDNGTAVAECSASAYSSFDSDGAYQVADVMSSLIYQARGVATESDAVVAAARDWNRCVTGKGIVGAAETPDAMPTSEMVRHFGNDTVDTPSAWVPSETELAWAVADSRCQDESGYRDLLYAAEWDAQVQILSEQRDDVARARTSIEDWRASIDLVIASHPAEHT